MTKFAHAQAIGQAGEYLVGSTIAHVLGWPYRMQPIADLGIDGEIEVLDDQRASAHGLIKVQVKTEEEPDGVGPSRVYLKKETFDYWTFLALPVIVCRPVLKTKKVYWLPSSAGRAAGTSIAFDFEEAHELTAESIPQLRKISSPAGKTLDLIAGMAAKALQLLTALQNRDERELLVCPEEFYREFDVVMKYVTAIEGMETLFPELLTDRSRQALQELEHEVGAIRGRKVWLDRNRDC